MGIERHRFSPSTSPSFATRRNKRNVIDSRRVPRQERPLSLADSIPCGSAQDFNMAEGINRHTSIPTIEISDPGDDRSLEASPAKDDHIGSPRRLKARIPTPDHHFREGFSGSTLAALKKKTYHVLSFGHEKDDGKGREHEDRLKAPLTDLAGPPCSSTWQRRAASMPVPKHAHMDTFHHADPIATRSYLASGSPPIVDFTRFEDRYRSPSSDYDTLLSVSMGSRGRNEREAMSSYSLSGTEKPGSVFAENAWGASKRDSHTVQVVGVNEMGRNSSGKRVLYPASERKPDPRLIMDALANTSELVDIWGLLDVDDILKIHDVDRQSFELRERDGDTGRNGRADKTRTVLGESIQNVFAYASTTITLGKREYILPIVVIHSVEEVYRTGIYQPNLFRTLPNRPRLHELISIFDSEEQPPGSIIRSRQSPSPSLEGFGAATSLHLESTPDICALLASYLSALPEPFLPPNLFEAIWELCEVDKQLHGDFLGLQPVPTTPGPVPIRLAKSYTSQCEASCIVIAQLLLHLLPSSHFFLFVYLLSFFSQVALVREENGVGIEDLSKMFGVRMFGHGYGDVSSTEASSTSDLQPSSKSSKAKGKEKERNGRGVVMMVWFLRRWGPLSETLFEIVDDVKLGLLHRNKRMRKDSLGKAAMTSAYSAAREALSAHDAVESEGRDEQEDGERDDEVENLVERELLEDGDVDGDVDVPKPVNIVWSPPTVHVPIATDSSGQDISSPPTFARKGMDLLPLPQGNIISSRDGAGSGPLTKDSSQSSTVSSGSSSSTLPPYTARPTPNSGTIEPDFNPTAARCPEPLPIERPEMRLCEAVVPGDDKLYHSTPKKSDLSDRMLGLMNRSVGDTHHSDKKAYPSRVTALRQQDEGIGPIGDEEGESADSASLASLHERLLDVSMPTTIFDFDETLPVKEDNPPSLLSLTSTFPISVTPTQEQKPHTVKIVGRNLTTQITSTSRFPSNTEWKRRVSPRRPSLNHSFLSPPHVPPLPAKSPERTRARLEPRLPVSRSAGLQNQPHSAGVSTPGAAIRNSQEDTDVKDAIINALRGRLVEVEKERDEARRIVMGVRRALRDVDDGALYHLLS